MSWIENFQLFLFDFDGLLVNTEEYHYRAYKKMMADRGVKLTWDFKRYCQSGHSTIEKFRRDLFNEFPELEKQDPTWKKLYEEKQRAIQELLAEKTPEMMPGAKKLLEALQQKSIKHCVVTHSPDSLVTAIRNKHPVLNNIPYWVTRHDYTHPKPHPECYLLAINLYSQPGDQIIGFEDTPRGMTALLGTQAKPVMITQIAYSEIEDFKLRGVSVFGSLSEISLNN